MAAEKALPFEVKDAETRAAMAELERGAAASFDSVAELMADLNAKDSARHRIQMVAAAHRELP